jgi:hypothetical protein
VLHPDTPDVQWREMRRAFYAGFFASLEFNLRVIGDPSISEEAGMALLEGMHEECRAFAELVAAGGA